MIKFPISSGVSSQGMSKEVRGTAFGVFSVHNPSQQRQSSENKNDEIKNDEKTHSPREKGE